MKPVIMALAALFLLLQYQLWFSQGGIVSVHKLDYAVNNQQKANATLALRNDTLAAEVTDLKTGNDAIAERARDDLGMVKQGETFYQIVPQQGQTHS